MSRPTEIVAGDTYTYTVTNSTYPASAGWTLKVTINNASVRLQVSAATASNGKDYDVTLASTNTDDLTTAGVYSIVEAVEKGAGASLERHTVYAGVVNVVKSITAAGAATDVRTTARKMLDAIETTILANFGKGHESMSIAARAIGYRSWDEMMRTRSRLKVEVKTEESLEKINQGLDGGNRIVARMGSGSWR